MGLAGAVSENATRESILGDEGILGQYSLENLGKQRGSLT